MNPYVATIKNFYKKKYSEKNIFLVPHPNGHFMSLYIEREFFRRKIFSGGGYKKCDFLSI